MLSHAFWRSVSHQIRLTNVTILILLAGLRRTGKSRHLVFTFYFAPFIIFFVAIVVMELMTSGFYLFDYFYNLSINGLIRILEIENSEEIRPILERISLSTRSVPSMIMFAAVSKFVLLLILNIILVFIFPRAAWQVCTENQDIVKVIQKMELKQTRPKSNSRHVPKSPTIPTVSRRMHQVDLTVSPVEEQTSADRNLSEDSPNQHFDQQPAFNPYVSNHKYETHF